MAIRSDVTGRASMPTKQEVKAYVHETKTSYDGMAAKMREQERLGIVDAERIIAQARKMNDPHKIRRELLAAAAAAENELALAEAELTKMQAKMLVDVLSFVDPTPITTGVSIWMEMQE